MIKGKTMNKSVSVVIPVYEESGNIAPLHSEIKSALEGLDFEIIFIDDGSSDGSWEEIKKAAAGDPSVRALRFSRNSGQTAALKAGIDLAGKEYIVTLDGDLQNDPADIKKLLPAVDEGYELVSGWRKDRKDAFFTRILPSRIANFFISLVTGVKLHDYGCSLKIYRADLLKEIELVGEMHRFLPALAGYRGGRIKELPVNHRPRLNGSSKYGIGRTFKVILDVLTVKFMGEFIGKPIYFFGGISLSLGAISVALALITLYNKLYNHIFVKDQPLFLVAIFMALAGIQIGMIGILSEIMSRIYYSSSGKSRFLIREKLNADEK